MHASRSTILSADRVVKRCMRHRTLQESMTAQLLIGNTGGGRSRQPLGHTERGVRPNRWEKPLEGHFDRIVGPLEADRMDAWSTLFGDQPVMWWDLFEDRSLWRAHS